MKDWRQLGFTEQEVTVMCDLSEKLDIAPVTVMRQGLRMLQAVYAGVAKFEMLDNSPGCDSID